MGSLLRLLVVAILLFPATASLAKEAQTTKVTVEDAQVSTREFVTQVSSAGASALDLIGAARSAIADGDYARATEATAEAERKLENLRTASPGTSLQQGIRSVQTTLARGDVEAAAAQLAPISESLTVVDDYTDVAAQLEIETDEPRYVAGSKAKQHIARALGHLEQRDVSKATAELQSAYETAVYTEVDLPLAASIISVGEALEALRTGAEKGYDKGYAKIVDDHLAAAQSRAQTVVSVARSATSKVDVAAEPD
ncbi:MAG: YfdX family protein [Myxococcota bacterium]